MSFPSRSIGEEPNLANLAALVYRRGDPARAEDLYRRSIALEERLLGPDHPDVALAVSNLAVLLAETGRGAEAEDAYRRALAIFEAKLPPDHPHRITCEENYEALRGTS